MLRLSALSTHKEIKPDILGRDSHRNDFVLENRITMQMVHHPFSPINGQKLRIPIINNFILISYLFLSDNTCSRQGRQGLQTFLPYILEL